MTDMLRSAMFAGGERWFRFTATIAWQVALVAVIVYMVTRLARNRSAAFRYALWMLVLVRLVLPTDLSSPVGVGTLVQSVTRYTQHLVPARYAADPARPASEMATAGPKRSLLAEGGSAPTGYQATELTVPSHQTRATPWPTPTVVVFLVWAAGIALFAGIVLIRFTMLLRAARQAEPIRSGPLFELFERCRTRVRVPSLLRCSLHSSADFNGPVVSGLFTPRIIMPKALVDSSSLKELEPLVLHELAHVKRFDLLVNWIQVVLQVVYWYNPIVWLVNREIRREREQACDDRVLVATGFRRKEYGSSLIKALEASPRPAPLLLGLVGVIEPWDSLKVRLRRIMDVKRGISARLTVSSLLLVLAMGCVVLPTHPRAKIGDQDTGADITAKVARLDIDTATLDDVIEIFGEPEEYVWGNQTFTKDNLPSIYCVAYPNRFLAVMKNGKIEELRFHEPGYAFAGKLQVGSDLEDVLEVVGQPTKTVEGERGRQDGVLYKDMNGRKGWCYYQRPDKGVRFFFSDYKVNALYVTRTDYGAVRRSAEPAPSARTDGSSDINAKVAQLDIDTATLDDVIAVFGEPEEYVWGQEKFTKDNLPSMYCAVYPNRLLVVMNGGVVEELRHHEPGYVYREKLQVGTPLEEVLEVVGRPTETVEGKPNGWKDGVLYKDIDGRKGVCYYARADQDVRFFFSDYRVLALYVTRTDFGAPGSPAVTSVKEFDDVRAKDLGRVDLSQRLGLLKKLTFNRETKWPERDKMPPGPTPEEIMDAAVNPGLGIRALHRQGITGKGVTVAIIDQPLLPDHREYDGKIVKYHDVGCEGSESSMHGPAVASLLVGNNCGTAPDARVYYVAAPSWTKDAAYQAEALGWIIAQNQRLPESEKIRVVSVSAAPSGPGSPFDKNNAMWDEACMYAEAAGILVLDCTNHHGFIGPCWLDATQPENVAACTPGFPRYPQSAASPRPGHILVPSCPRTTAQHYDYHGRHSYIYWAQGGLSWAIPYSAGVLAMGWQLRPELPPEQMRELLFESAHVKDNGARIINPKAFIELVRNTRAAPRTAVRSRRPEYRMLLTNLTSEDADAIVVDLQTRGVPYKFGDGGGTILVPSEQVYSLRNQISQAGTAPSGQVRGWEIFDRATLGMTEFLQNINAQRARAGELARTIEAYSAVRRAIVDFSIPEERMLATQEAEPSATIVLQLTHPGALDPVQIRGIRNVVAASVPRLSPDRVTVLETDGAMLAR